MKRRLGRLLLGLAVLGLGLGVLIAVRGGNGAPLLMGGAFAGVLGGAFLVGQSTPSEANGRCSSSDSTSSGPDQGGGGGGGGAGGDGGCGGDGGGE